MGSICSSCTDVVEKPNIQTTAKRQYLKKHNTTNDEKDEYKISDGNLNQITIYVIQARNLPNYDSAPNAKCDPYVKVTIANDKYVTKTVTKESNAVWNTSFVKTGKGLFKTIKNIKFDVYDQDLLSNDDFIGSCLINTNQSPNTFYSTPTQWIELKDKNNNIILNKNKQKAAIQIQIKYVLDEQQLNIRYYTHVLQLNIKKAKNIHDNDIIGKSDPYIKVEFGSQAFQSKYITNTLQPVFNETTYIFIHNEYNTKYQLKLTLMDKDIGPDDMLGCGYIQGSQIFDNCLSNNNNKYTFDVNCRMIPVNLDRGLLDFKDDKFKPWGDIECEAILIDRNKIENDFYSFLLKSFDKNNDGVIDRSEIETMFAVLRIPNDIDNFFEKFDDNLDNKFNEDEIIKMLQDSNFQGSELSTQLISLYLNGNLKDNDYQKHLMSGFTNKHVPTSKAIQIKDRVTGLIVQEFVPSYIWYSLQLLYNSKLNLAIAQTSISKRIINKLSKDRGKKMDKPQSAKEIKGFIKQHNLDTSSLYRAPSEFKTFNDFFARGMDVDKCRPISDINNESVILSPADCRMMLWDNILDSTKLWIKGKSFTLENLINSSSTSIDYKKYYAGSFVIARLAPQDYHRWHWPLGGKVIHIEKINGALYTVSPIAINKTIDVYTSNKRAVIEVDTGNNNNGHYLLFVIAATMVGSYNLFKEESDNPSINNPIPLNVNDDIKRGDVAGEFRFGGSTILILFEPNKVKFDDDIKRNVAQKYETLMNARNRIGIIQ